MLDELNLAPPDVLEALNLAPPDVLEALNRLLDDNRELRIPETGEVVKPAPGFALFATQNPAGVCAASDATHGGRKPLSRAFRDRFVEIHVDELSGGELADVVARVGGVAPSLAARLVDAHGRLRRLCLRWGRDGGSLFEGIQSLCSSRDVLKWAARFGGDGDGLLALAVGDAIVAQRLRCDADVVAVRRELAAALGVDAGARSTS